MAPGQLGFVEGQRVAHLATADARATPHLVPVCFAVSGHSVYIALDSKPKSVEPLSLKRVRNILSNPRVSLLVDHYEEDWTRLGWVRIDGRAEIVVEGDEQAQAVRLLRRRYDQYAEMLLEKAPIIALRIERVSGWGDLSIPNLTLKPRERL